MFIRPSEAPLPGVSGQTIVDEIMAHGHRGVDAISRGWIGSIATSAT